jgi:hypothetical protein
MTPAEQYRTLVRRLDAILEQGLKPPQVNAAKLPNWNYQSMPDDESKVSGKGSPWPDSEADVPKSEPIPKPTQPNPPPVPHGSSPAMTQFEQRCQSLIRKLSAYTTEANQQIISKITVTVVDDPEDDDLYSYPLKREIVLDYRQWDDAPDDVLLWSLGHEVGHICFAHRSRGVTPQQSQQQELAADQFATRLCLAMGITAAPAFKWANDKRDRLSKYPAGSLHQIKLNLQNNPANADSQQLSTHPTYNTRFDHAAQDKFELSRVDTDQLDRFTAHMSRVA